MFNAKLKKANKGERNKGKDEKRMTATNKRNAVFLGCDAV
jgi:hypothetical protein